MTAGETPDIASVLNGIDIVDAHHHFWELSRFPYDWLAPASSPGRFGDKASLRRDYLALQYLGDFAGIPLSASVHVQANCGAKDPVEETRWLQSVADETGWPSAIIAEVDLLSPGAARQIERNMAFSRFRGVRTPVGWDAAGRWRIASRPHVMMEPGFRRMLPMLEARDLCLEIVIVPEQFRELVDLARAHPTLKIVVDHFSTLELNRANIVHEWMTGIDAIADLTNIHVKLSGLWTVDKAWSAPVLTPFVRHLLDAVGAGRVMYGSNLPIEAVNCPLRDQFAQLGRILIGCSRDDLERIFSTTARRVYRLESG